MRAAAQDAIASRSLPSLLDHQLPKAEAAAHSSREKKNPAAAPSLLDHQLPFLGSFYLLSSTKTTSSIPQIRCH